jgi:hypothetical protein
LKSQWRRRISSGASAGENSKPERYEMAIPGMKLNG